MFVDFNVDEEDDVDVVAVVGIVEAGAPNHITFITSQY